MPLSFTRITGLRYYRNTPLIRRDGIDHYGLMLMTRGAFRGDAAGIGFEGRAGSLLVGDFARACDMESSDAHSITISLPRRIAEAAIPDLARQHGRVISPERAAMLTDFVVSLHRNAASLRATDMPRLTRILFDLIAGAIDCDTTDGPVPVGGDGRLWRARRLIDAQLGARDLDVDLLCAMMRVSRATLYRLFEPLGGVAAYIRHERLARAAKMIDDGASPQSIAAVAHACGFSDAAHFSRAFRLRYGESPSERRARNQEIVSSRDAQAGEGPNSIRRST